MTTDYIDFKNFAPQYQYYKLNACKVEYYPHQNKSIANPIPSYTTFTPANISTSQPPICTLWSPYEKVMTTDEVFKHPQCKYREQGRYFTSYRKLRMPLIVAGQGTSNNVDILLGSRKPWVSTDDTGLIWGKFYHYIQDVDQEFLDNNDRHPMSCTWKYTIYCAFIKPLL